MNNKKKATTKLLSLLDNSLVQFLLGIFLVAILTQIASSIDNNYSRLLAKTLGYGVFYYLATPFIIYWLSYVSSEKLTRLKVMITILLVGIYSYIFWDSYFFYKQILGEIFFSPSLI